MPPQICQVEIWQARNQQFQLLVRKDLDQLAWHEFMKTFQEFIDLLLDVQVKIEVREFLKVFMFVLLSYLNRMAVLNQVD